MIALCPSLRSVRMHETAHQSNSTDEPMRYAPQPRTIVVRWPDDAPGATSDSVPLYVMYR